MAIKKIDESAENLRIEINNGDFNALNEIIKKWKFKDKESALRFAIAILSVTENGTLCKEDKSTGARGLLQPTEGLTNE